MSRPFEKALSEIFKAFDQDQDGFLSKDELRKFSIACNENGRCFEDEELQEISDFFDWNEDATPPGLSLTGWFDMYHTQTSGEEEETCKDLKCLGFDAQLNWVSSPPSSSSSSSSSTTVAATVTEYADDDEDKEEEEPSAKRAKKKDEI